MSLKFACPGCQKAMKVDERLAGKVAKCPACGVKLKIPTPKPVAAGAAGNTSKPTSRAPAASSPDTSGGLPFDESEWDEALNPFESPKAEVEKVHNDFEKPKIGITRKQMRWTRRGLKMVNYGLNGAALCVILIYALSFYQRFDKDAELGSVVLVLVGLYSLCGLLLFVGPYLCVTVPEKTGAKSQAIVAACSQTAVVVLVGALLNGLATDAAALFMLGAMILVAAMSSYFSFLKFMVKLANFLGQKEIAESVKLVITLGVINVVCYALVFAIPILAISFPDFDWLFALMAIGVSLTLLVCGLWALGAYASAVNKLSKLV